MIVVKIELESAITGRTTEIGRMYVTNQGTSSDPRVGNYTVAVCRRGTEDLPRPIEPDGPAPTRSGEVIGHRRLDHNVWRLIAKAVLSAFPEERIPRAFKGSATTIDEQIMRGLNTLVDRAQEFMHDGRLDDDASVAAALAWLNAAGLEHVDDAP